MYMWVITAPPIKGVAKISCHVSFCANKLHHWATRHIELGLGILGKFKELNCSLIETSE